MLKDRMVNKNASGITATSLARSYPSISLQHAFQLHHIRVPEHRPLLTRGKTRPMKSKRVDTSRLRLVRIAKLNSGYNSGFLQHL